MTVRLRNKINKDTIYCKNLDEARSYINTTQYTESDFCVNVLGIGKHQKIIL